MLLPSDDDIDIVGRNIMLVIVSGFHSIRICAFHELLRVKPWLSALANEDDELTKFSDDVRLSTSPSLWFQRTDPSHDSVVPLS